MDFSTVPDDFMLVGKYLASTVNDPSLWSTIRFKKSRIGELFFKGEELSKVIRSAKKVPLSSNAFDKTNFLYFSDWLKTKPASDPNYNVCENNWRHLCVICDNNERWAKPRRDKILVHVENLSLNLIKPNQYHTHCRGFCPYRYYFGIETRAEFRELLEASKEHYFKYLNDLHQKELVEESNKNIKEHIAMWKKVMDDYVKNTEDLEIKNKKLQDENNKLKDENNFYITDGINLIADNEKANKIILNQTEYIKKMNEINLTNMSILGKCENCDNNAKGVLLDANTRKILCLKCKDNPENLPVYEV